VARSFSADIRILSSNDCSVGHYILAAQPPSKQKGARLAGLALFRRRPQECDPSLRTDVSPGVSDRGPALRSMEVVRSLDLSDIGGSTSIIEPKPNARAHISYDVLRIPGEFLAIVRSSLSVV
jgi:hypothetical protein